MHTFLLLLILIALLGGGAFLIRCGKLVFFVIGCILSFVIPFGALLLTLHYLFPKADLVRAVLNMSIFVTVVISLHLLAYAGEEALTWVSHRFKSLWLRLRNRRLQIAIGRRRR
jgi:hypothetical protein